MTGLGLAALGFVGKYALRAAPGMSQKMAEAVKTLPKMDSQVNMGRLLFAYLLTRAQELQTVGDNCQATC